MCMPITSVQVDVFGVSQEAPHGTTPAPRPPLPLDQGGICLGLRHPHPPTSGDSRPEPSVHCSLSGYPLQLRAASSRVRVTPDQVGGAPASGGWDEPREETSRCWPELRWAAPRTASPTGLCVPASWKPFWGSPRGKGDQEVPVVTCCPSAGPQAPSP